MGDQDIGSHHLNAEMQAQLDSYEIEFYELVTPEKLAERGVS